MKKKLGLTIVLFSLVIFWFIVSFREPEVSQPVSPVPYHTAAIQRHNPIDSVYRNALSFSMNGEYVAYLFHHSKKVKAQADHGRLSQKSLTDSLYIKWFPVDTPSEVCSLLIDAIDLGTEGYHRYELSGNLQSNKYRNKFAVISPRNISILNPEDCSSAQIVYEDEFFGNGRWLDGDTILFSTIKEDSISFWKLYSNAEPDERVAINSQYKHYYNKTAPKLQEELWSSNGEFVIFSNEVLVNTATGGIKTFPFSLMYSLFSEDAGRFIVRDVSDKYDRLFLVESESGKVKDLTPVFQDSIGRTGVGEELSIGFDSWADSETLIMRKSVSKRPKTPFQSWGDNTKYLLIQPSPFKIVLTSEHLNSTPLNSWVEKYDNKQLSLFNFETGDSVEIDLGYNVIKKWSSDLKHYITISENRPIVHTVKQN